MSHGSLASLDHRELVIDGHPIELTHLSKPLYPNGFTKSGALDYYTRVAEALLPHLRGRPVTRKRYVHGVGSAEHPDEGFFTKTLERGAPAWIETRDIAQADRVNRYPLVQDTATLTWLVQLDAIELHVPQWRFAEPSPQPRHDEQGAAGRPVGSVPAPPDRLVVDLDPGAGFGLVECAVVARLARGRLIEHGLDPIPVTTGSKGIHLYAALDGRADADEVTTLAHDVALALQADHPDLVVTGARRAVRHGHVFVDWSQNRAGKTTISPYSLRGTLEPQVAAPRTWRELASPSLAHPAPSDVLRRLDERGDLLAPLLQCRANTSEAPGRAG